MKIIKALSLFLILSLSSGCFYLPVPQSSEQGDKIFTLLEQLKEGKTTKKEVILIMGEPDESTEKSIVYWRREYSAGYKGYFLYGRPLKRNDSARVSEIEPQPMRIDLFFEFDSHGVLTRYSAGNDNVRESYGFPKSIQAAESRVLETKARCYSECDDSYHSCINSDIEGNLSKSPCEEEKLFCSKSCEKVKRLKRNGEDLCLKWETNNYVPCNNPAN